MLNFSNYQEEQAGDSGRKSIDFLVRFAILKSSGKTPMA
jgi:hypothetical protein